MKKVKYFLNRQVSDFRNNNLIVLSRKARTFLFLIVPSIFAIPIVIIIRLLRPFILIRFGKLSSGRIGHYAINTEMYLCEGDLGMRDTKGVDIFFNANAFPYAVSDVCNKQLKKMWSRIIPVVPMARFLYIANNWIPGGEKHITTWRHRQAVDLLDVLARTKPKLCFTEEEECMGARMLKEIGVPEGAPYVCFHVRDSAYLKKIAPSRDWHYHDYRDCDIENFIPAMKELTRHGYYVLRMGNVVEKPLKTTNDKIIDYAVKYRTDFLDIFLCAKCNFFVGTGAGIDAIPRVFRRPIAYPDIVPIEYMPLWSSKDIGVPNKIWLKAENRFLAFKEIFDMGASHFLHTEQYDELGIEVVENTAEEITALVIEMHKRLTGAWVATEEDEELQSLFWSIYKPIEPYKAIRSRVGAEFLRQNRDLLKPAIMHNATCAK